jgi:NADH-quinone oxidoreductase subunit L
VETAVKNIWLVPFFPLVAAAISSLLPQKSRKISAALAILAMTASLFVSVWAFKITLGAAHEHESARAIYNFTWFTFGSRTMDLGFILDPLTACMLVMVTFVGLMIFIFSTGYMAEDENFTRFFCFMSLFAAAMLGLVIANNLLFMFICWELVGLCSYLLIGFWYFKDSASNAAVKAFVTTRIGDIGFFIGILLLFWHAGTVMMYDNGGGALERAEEFAAMQGWLGLTLASTIAILLFFGAMGKSAQFPLHVWLPDAMEGPTPVSALIHAATMVAAGVFMVGRMFPLFVAGAGEHGTTAALQFVMWIGCFTAILTATIAVAQRDIKRVLAYSTCSQLGFMMMALGAGGLSAGQFHLLTHAFFKALLFLGAGSVIIGTHHEQDMMKMGGLRKSMPVTFATFLIGTLALAGFPLTAGFFSKDEVLLVTFHASKLAWGIATFAAFLTAFYMTRQVCLVFLGDWRGKNHGEPHETPKNMTLPLCALAFFALVLGWFGTPWTDNPFHHFVAPDMHAPHDGWQIVMGASVVVGLLGIAIGWLIYGRKPLAAGEPDPLQAKLGALYTWLQNKWYFDELYAATAVRLTHVSAELFGFVDRKIIDGILHGIARITTAISNFVRNFGDEIVINGGFDAACQRVRDSGWLGSKLQSGQIQRYFRVLSLGAGILFVLYYLWL